MLPPQKGDSLEADEMWSFVASKKNQIWTWLCVSFLTGQVVAYAVGDRSADTCKTLFNRVPKAWRKKLVYTDLYSAYFATVPKWKHRPSEKGSGRTNTVERTNNSIRQRLARFVRRSLSFSKCPKMHEKTLLVFLHNHNKTLANSLSNRY